MKSPYTKSIYKPRYRGWRFVRAMVVIADGILYLFGAPFGYDSNLYIDYCERNLRKDIERRKAIKNEVRKSN